MENVNLKIIKFNQEDDDIWDKPYNHARAVLQQVFQIQEQVRLQNKLIYFEILSIILFQEITKSASFKL